MVILKESMLAEGPVLPAWSVTPPAARRSATVPAEQLVTVRVIDAPLEAEGVKVQPVAVPRLVKSPDEMPLTDSEKLRV